MTAPPPAFTFTPPPEEQVRSKSLNEIEYKILFMTENEVSYDPTYITCMYGWMADGTWKSREERDVLVGLGWMLCGSSTWPQYNVYCPASSALRKDPAMPFYSAVSLLYRMPFCISFHSAHLSICRLTSSFITLILLSYMYVIPSNILTLFNICFNVTNCRHTTQPCSTWRIPLDPVPWRERRP